MDKGGDTALMRHHTQYSRSLTNILLYNSRAMTHDPQSTAASKYILEHHHLDA